MLQYAYILYLVLKSRYYPTTIESLRSSMQRAHNRHHSAYRLGELIDKHGDENWLKPLMEDMGPYIQLQLGDIANMLEVFAKSVIYTHFGSIFLMKPKTVFTTGRGQGRPLHPSGFSLLACSSLCVATWRSVLKSLAL